MDYRVVFGVLLVFLAVQAAPTDDLSVQRDKISQGPLALNEEDKKALLEVTKQNEEGPRLHARDEISHGPMVLNEADKKALSEMTKQNQDPLRLYTSDEISLGPLVLTEEDKKALFEVNELVNQINKGNPDEEAHGHLVGLVDSVTIVTDVVRRLMGKVEENEEKSHSAIEKLQSTNPDTTDVCVQEVFGIPPRMNPVYCGVKYFSQVAMGLYELTKSVTPLKQNLLRLQSDLKGCKQKEWSETLICTAQASRDAWDTSDYSRALLGQHLTIIRFLVLEISNCIKTNHALQSNLVNEVALCAIASNKKA